MRRVQNSKHINRNNDAKLDHASRSNASCEPITPEINVGQIWLQEDNANTNGIQIIELNSSNSDGSVESLDTEDRKYPLSYTNNERVQRMEDTFRTNRKAREMRRARNASPNTPISPQEADDIDENYELEDLYLSLASNQTHENLPRKHEVNCFTIINKHVMDSDTSSDNIDYEDLDILTPRDLFQNPHLWNRNLNTFEDEVVPFDPEQCSEKRTIWIYSFKNKRLLSENDFELVNIPSTNNTSDSTSAEENVEENSQKAKPVTMCRVPSPFPAPYVPKLNLSKGPALSTLTEVTEPKKPSSGISNETDNSSEEEFVKHKHNGWFLNDDKDTGNEKNKNTNVINWMALSPRERRRRFRNVKVDLILPTLPESSSHVEVDIKHENLGECETHKVVNVVADVVVHTVDKAEDITSITTTKRIRENQNTQDDCAIETIFSEDAIQEYENGDRGDYERKSLRKIQINVGPKKLANAVISDPIEKLEGSNWIAEDNKENIPENMFTNTETGVKRVDNESDVDTNSASYRLWARNLCLIKPAQWNEYATIADSPMVLHLSLDSLVEIKQSWYKRLLKCLKCCKSNN